MTMNLNPSNAHIWRYCAGHVHLAALNPEPKGGDNESARWGSALAEFSAKSLKARLTFDRWLTQNGMVDGKYPIASNGVTCDLEMIESAQAYTEVVLETAGDAVLHIEESLDIPRIDPSMTGKRPDCWFVTAGMYHVYELKGGHRFVDEYENWQNICYAAGIVSDADELAARVAMHVFQPRAFHRRGPDREWSVMARDLRPYVNMLANAAMDARGDDPKCVAGDYCRDCRGRVYCEAGASAAYSAAEQAYSSLPLDVTPLAMGAELKMLQRAQKMLDARVTGLEEMAKVALQRGDAVPFYTLEQGNGRQDWTMPASEIAMLGEMFGVKVMKDPQPVTPKQAIKAGLDAETVAQYSHTPRGEMKLKPVDDRQASRIFGGN
jgi:hypothetical protein